MSYISHFRYRQGLLQLFALILLPTLLSFETAAQFYNGSQMEFGKNRVQHREFFWTYYSYDRYEVYFYEQGKDIANYVSKAVKKNLEELELLFDYSLEGKIQFICYNKQSDFQQSNLGLVAEDQYNVGGVTRIVGSKVVLYFEGDHRKLNQQIRAGIAEVLVNQMMYGGDLKDMLKNSTLLTLPEWYVKGIISYASNEWNVDIDDRVKDGILSGKYTKFNRLTGVDAVYAGHSIWNFIAEKYGKNVISNILYMTKVSRNVESAFLFVLGISVRNLSKEWIQSYHNSFQDADSTKSLPSKPGIVKKPKETRVYTQLKVSPNGKQLVYVTNELGQYKIWLHDLSTNKTKRIVKVGHKLDRINDYSYPIIAWHPSGSFFGYITEKKSQVFLTTYTLENGDKQERGIINFEKILDFSYSSDGKKFVMSAVQNGQSDIFVLTASSNAFEQITKDIYDDLHPRFVHNTKEIVFSSNRKDDTIRSNVDPAVPLAPTTDLFVYNYISRSNVLKRVTTTPAVSETHPTDYDSLSITYLSDLNGIRNRYIARFDSVIDYVDTAAHYRYLFSSQPMSNYSRNIQEHDVAVKSGKYAEIFYFNGRYRMFVNDFPKTTALLPSELKNTKYRTEKIKEEEKYIRDQQLESKRKDSLTAVKRLETVTVVIKKDTVVKKDTGNIDINNYTFDNEQRKTSKKAPVIIVTEAKPVVPDSSAVKAVPQDFQLARQRNYYINYATDYIVSQLDNNFLNASYQKFTGGQSPIYLSSGFTGLFKIGMSDLFEDYRIVGGFRLSGDLNSNEFLLSHENRVKNLDKQLILHRQAFLNVSGGGILNKVHTHEVRYTLKWPFNEVASIRGSLNLRNDRIVFLATDINNLRRNHIYEYWAAGKLEYVFDNTLKKGLNLYNGLRSKVFAEYFRQLNEQETDFVVTGFDVRYYQKVHRDIIWANRLAGSTSFGRQKLIYYMGGVDGWFSPKFDRSINVATDQNYAYQTLATNMRGFYQNIRNGNTFVVGNSELRIPVFKYFLNRPIKSDFVNNFQVIGFGDIGTAWTGKSPYSEENSLNKTVKSALGNPITITLNSQKEPIIGGYGFGLRSRIWGYFVRFDWAWGIEDGIVLPRINYLSLSLDF